MTSGRERSLPAIHRAGVCMKDSMHSRRVDSGQYVPQIHRVGYVSRPRSNVRDTAQIICLIGANLAADRRTKISQRSTVNRNLGGVCLEAGVRTLELKEQHLCD